MIQKTMINNLLNKVLKVPLLLLALVFALVCNAQANRSPPPPSNDDSCAVVAAHLDSRTVIQGETFEAVFNRQVAGSRSQVPGAGQTLTPGALDLSEVVQGSLQLQLKANRYAPNNPLLALMPSRSRRQPLIVLKR